jgi:hypothetical protein
MDVHVATARPWAHEEALGISLHRGTQETGGKSQIASHSKEGYPDLHEIDVEAALESQKIEQQ